MAESKSLEILKGAILLERRGKAFYQNVAGQAKDPAIRRIFETMAEEEQQHIEFLAKQYSNLAQGGGFDPVKMNAASYETAKSVLTEGVQKNISAAGYEASAISAAMAMEERAVNYYAERASSSEDKTEKELYQQLADWERTHFKILRDIDKELTEKVWFDNQFWPVI
jgi:rubrerythrin